MNVEQFASLFRRRGFSSGLVCLPAVLVIGVSLAAGLPDRRMTVECSALLVVCLLQVMWPTLLGWTVVFAWFALSTVETISLALRPGFGLQPLPIAVPFVPALLLGLLRPRPDKFARHWPARALLVGLVLVGPRFLV
jgi:hypothetical protein